MKTALFGDYEMNNESRRLKKKFRGKSTAERELERIRRLQYLLGIVPT